MPETPRVAHMAVGRGGGACLLLVFYVPGSHFTINHASLSRRSSTVSTPDRETHPPTFGCSLRFFHRGGIVTEKMLCRIRMKSEGKLHQQRQHYTNINRVRSTWNTCCEKIEAGPTEWRKCLLENAHENWRGTTSYGSQRRPNAAHLECSQYYNNSTNQ